MTVGWHINYGMHGKCGNYVLIYVYHKYYQSVGITLINSHPETLFCSLTFNSFVEHLSFDEFFLSSLQPMDSLYCS